MLTLDRMRRDIAGILQEDPNTIGDDDNLIDLGLDSIRAMMLIQEWNTFGARLDLPTLAERPVLSTWWALAHAGRTRDGAA